MEHTEEDWKIVKQDGCVYIGTIEDKVTYGTMICKINLGNKQALANAKLMAASKELLNALRGLLDYPKDDLKAWAKYNTHTKITLYGGDLIQALEAIEKATK